MLDITSESCDYIQLGFCRLAAFALVALCCTYTIAAPSDDSTPSNQSTDQLWKEALKYQKEQDWEHLDEVLQKIVRLEPHNFEVQGFVAHTLMYNVAVEFDAVEKRYDYATRAIRVLIEGLNNNPDDVRFADRLAWMISSIGKSDDHLEFRRLFADDNALRAELAKQIDISKSHGPNGKPDNFLVARLFYEKAEQIAEKTGKLPATPSKMLFYSESAMAQVHFAEALENDGFMGDESLQAWHEARKLWESYSRRDLETASGIKIRLAELDQYRSDAKRAWDSLDAVYPHLHNSLLESKRNTLTPDQQHALDTPAADRSAKQQELASDANNHLRIGPRDIEAALGQKKDEKTRALGQAVIAADRRVFDTETYRDIINYDHWVDRLRLEPTTAIRNAREKTFLAESKARATKQNDRSTIEGSRHAYDAAVAAWKESYQQFPSLIENELIGDDIGQFAEDYRKRFQPDQPLPSDFPLIKFWKRYPPLERAPTHPSK